ncbi:sensor histidine kinase [Kitasatospora kifunensis]|uniref:Two-component system NarL family sensor kinase n=1 Tax=Kitasatospora kifunensis TaxID=58351 RepID=A0A7W7R904_KITKI|nr:ATP-binding protein [Kitasatospora kifunensis]MBB4927662.1 two-component system NarL family sensor kinase [Kitasatospora kifunensis]
MTTRWRELQLSATAGQSVLFVAWLRLLMFVPLLLSGLSAGDHVHSPWFGVLLALYALWAIVRLVWLSRGGAPDVRATWWAAAIDLVAISVLSILAGGEDSEVRFALYVLPIASILWLLPRVTVLLTVVCAAAYALVLVPQLITDRVPQLWPLVVDEAYLLWNAAACVLIVVLLARRTRRVAELLDGQELLLQDALAAETRERAELADTLHDGAVQDLLAALHELEEAEESAPSAALSRAEGEVRRVVREMREVIFDLHPQVLQAAGLEAALRSAGERFARRGGFTVRYDLRLPERVAHEGLLYSVARELLTNVVKHARAEQVGLGLWAENGETVLTVADDGAGFDPAIIRQRLREGHVGLASHYVRVESAGGSFSIRSAPGQHTTVEVRLPG